MKIKGYNYDELIYTPIYDTDDRVVWDRTPKILYCLNKTFLPYFSKYRMSFEQTTCYQWIDEICFDKTKNGYNLHITSLYVGVAPFIYRFFVVFPSRPYGNDCGIKPFIVSEEDFNASLVDRIKELINTTNDVKLYNSTNLSKNSKSNDLKWVNHIYKCKEVVWKIEDNDFFNKIMSPTFIYFDYDNSSIITDLYMMPKHCFDNGFYYIVKDTIISNLNIDGYHDAMKNCISDRDVYNDIENFLWKMNEVEPKPIDDKTKIDLYGFDKKTSFRKM